MNEWGIVELFGHVRLAGRVREVERFGSRLGMVEIPDMRPGAAPDAFLEPHFFGGGAVYRYRPVSEEDARRCAALDQGLPLVAPPQLGAREEPAGSAEWSEAESERPDWYNGDEEDEGDKTP